MSTKLKAGTATSGAVIDADTAGILELQSGSTPTTAITIDANQNIGIGVTPSAWSLSGGKAIQLSSTTAIWNFSNVNSYFTNNLYYNGSARIFLASGYASEYSQAAGTHVWSYSSASGTAGGTATMNTAMALDASGNLTVGGSTNGYLPRVTLQYGSGQAWGLGPISSAQNNFYVINGVATGVYLATGNTSWTANSDERLKTDLKPIKNAVDKVNQLRSVTGRYKTDEEGTSRSFLIAQDVQKVLPEAVNIQEDEIGTLGVQYTDVIPLLVASIKELNAKVTALEAQLGVK